MKDRDRKREAPKRTAARPESPKKGKKSRGLPGPLSVVSPRDERGTPYRGDFPSPLRPPRDCF
jgi:hypothetical protein